MLADPSNHGPDDLINIVKVSVKANFRVMFYPAYLYER
jgi:hypothetical protein